jgi:hypothetical protein
MLRRPQLLRAREDRAGRRERPDFRFARRVFIFEQGDLLPCFRYFGLKLAHGWEKLAEQAANGMAQIRNDFRAALA